MQPILQSHSPFVLSSTATTTFHQRSLPGGATLPGNLKLFGKNVRLTQDRLHKHRCAYSCAKKEKTCEICGNIAVVKYMLPSYVYEIMFFKCSGLNKLKTYQIECKLSHICVNWVKIFLHMDGMSHYVYIHVNSIQIDYTPDDAHGNFGERMGSFVPDNFHSQSKYFFCFCVYMHMDVQGRY